MSTSAETNPSLPPHRKVRVDLGPRSYDVVIGRGLLDQCASLVADAGINGPVAIISDTTVAKLYAQRVENLLNAAGLGSFLVTVPAGEKSKSMEQVTRLLSELAKKRVSRSGAVIGLGGGVVGDLSGYVAASYLRGVNFVQIPTTLLAMVDSSVGGKTGANLPEGKNLVGAFHQPKLVLADLVTLDSFIPTDPSVPGASFREFAAGMAEVIKYGAIKDKALFDRVAKGVKPDDADLDEIVEKCVAIKARIVENDEFETKGERALLNFGHTIGHAIEKAGDYKAYLHGEAISLGMRAAAWLSVWHSSLPESDAKRIEIALTANNLPITLKPNVNYGDILAALGNDKKVAADGKNRWVLLKSLGEAVSGHEIPGDLVRRAVSLLFWTKENTDEVIECLSDLSDREKQLALWTGRTSGKQSDFVETVEGLFTDTGLSDALDSGSTAFSTEVVTKLRELSAQLKKVQSRGAALSIIDDPAMPRVREIASEVLTLLKKGSA